MAKSHDNRSNCGGGFVFVGIFGIKLGKSLLIPKNFYKCERFTQEQIESLSDFIASS